MTADKKTLLAMYRTMVTIRQFETMAGEYFAAGQIPGFIHLSIRHPGGLSECRGTSWQLSRGSHVSTWLLRITTFTALKVLRNRKGLPTISLEEATEPDELTREVPHPEFIADCRHSPEELVGRREIAALLEAALDRLDEKHRLIFLLRDLEGFSVRETAEALNLSEANVKVRLLRARLELREHLTRKLGDPTRVLKQEHAPHG